MSEDEPRDQAQDPTNDRLLAALGSEQRRFDAAVESEVVAELADEEGLLDAVFALADADDADDADAAETNAPQVPEPVSLSSRRRTATWVMPLVAMAAALVLWVAMRPPGPVAPGYELVSVQAGRAEVRGAESPEQIQLMPGDTVALTLAPERDVEVAVALAVVARDADGKGTVRRPSVGVQVDASGSVRVDSTLERLADVEPGAYALEFWVGPAEALPQAGEVAPKSSDPRVAVIAVPILVSSGG